MGGLVHIIVNLRGKYAKKGEIFMSVAPCSHCGGSGYLPTGKYCSCTNAKLEKALKNSERRAKEATAKKEKEKREKQTAMEFAEDQKPKKGEPPFQEGEWVEVFGLYSDFGKGITFIVDENNTKYEYSRILAYSDDEGDDRVGKYKVNWSNLKAATSPPDEDDLLTLIDMALETHDKEWFEQLTAMLP